MTAPRAEGSALQWDEVYAAHFDFVWRSLRRLGVSEANADDATHDVFVVAFRRMADFEGRSSIKTWLFGIAYHIARHVRRRCARTCVASLDGIENAAGPAVGDPQSAALHNEAKRLVYQILDSMPAEKRDVFVMAELEQMSAPEMAKLIGVPVNTIYSRLRNARHDFEAALRREQARQTWRTP